ncbi:unnamed protein product [Brassica rapa subsp. trilocularis]
MISLLIKSTSLPAFSFLFLVAESDQGSSFLFHQMRTLPSLFSTCLSFFLDGQG